jgi:hypothetical protein
MLFNKDLLSRLIESCDFFHVTEPPVNTLVLLLSSSFVVDVSVHQNTVDAVQPYVAPQQLVK